MRFSEIVTGALLVAGGAAVMRQVREYEREARRRELADLPREGRPRRIVVVGAGFGGLAAANYLGEQVGDDPGFEVLLVDRHNFHLFYPLLYQVATGGLEPGTLAYPVRIVGRHHGFRFEEVNVEKIDLERKRLETDAGPIEYDSLILAPGSVTNFFGMKDAAERVIPLKSLQDGVRLRNRIVEAFELASREDDPERRKALLTFVLIGGGATGVELAASLSDMIFTALLPNYPSIDRQELGLHLVESKDTLLPGWDPRVQQTAMRTLRARGVQLELGTLVSHVTDDGVEMKNGQRLAAATVVWTAGVKAAPLIEQLPGERERDGRIHVDEHLALPGHPDVYLAGDSAWYRNPATGKPVPPTAEAALNEGYTAAQNVLRQLRGEPLPTYVFHSKGELVSLGRGAAAASLFGVAVSGLPAWIIRRLVYLVNLVGFRNRLLVVIDWAFVSFHQRVISSFESLGFPKRESALLEMASAPETVAPSGGKTTGTTAPAAKGAMDRSTAQTAESSEEGAASGEAVPRQRGRGQRKSA